MGARLYIFLVSFALALPMQGWAASHHGRGAETSHGGAVSEDKSDEAAKEGSESEAEKAKEEKKKEEAKKDAEAVDKLKSLGDKATDKDLVAIEDKIKELSIKQNAEAEPDPERTKLINDLYASLANYRMVQDIAATNAANLAAETAAMETPPTIEEAPAPPPAIQEQAVQILKIEPAPTQVAPPPTQSPLGPVNLSSTPYTPAAAPQKVSLTPINKTPVAQTAPAQVALPATSTAPESLPIRVSSTATPRPTMPELSPLPATSYRQSSETRPSAPMKTAAPISQPVTTAPTQEYTPPTQNFENTPTLSVIRAGTPEVAAETTPTVTREVATITIPNLEPPVKERAIAEPGIDPFAQSTRNGPTDTPNTVAWNPPEVSPEARALFGSDVFASSIESATTEAEINEPTGELEKFIKEKPAKKAAKVDDLAEFLRTSLRR